MTTLVIGGNGFIGSHIVDVLRAGGEDVAILDRMPERYRPPLPDVHYYLGDLRDMSVVEEALHGGDRVIHAASSSVPQTAVRDPAGDISDNLLPLVQLLATMRRTGVKRLVYLSSGGTVYGPPLSDTITEDHPLRPVTPYGIVKAAAERYIVAEHMASGLGYAILRPANPFGPRQGRLGVQGVIGTFLWQIAQEEMPEVWGDGSVVRDFVHVGDLARLCLLALRSSLDGCYNVGSGRGCSIAELIALLSEATGRPIVPLRRPGREFDLPRVVLDCSRARELLGWSATMTLEAGLAETWAWLQAEAGLPPPVNTVEQRALPG